MQLNSPSLDEVKSHFDHWRATRTKRGAISDHFWHMVKQIIGHYSITVITQTLGINTNQIRNNLDRPSGVHFVEVNADAMPRPQKQPRIKTTINGDTPQAYTVELYRSNGSILKISELPVASLNAIITQFME